MSMYIAAVAVAVVIAAVAGDLGVLWRLTLFTEAGGGVTVTWPGVSVLVAAGLAWAWALCQGLRGPPPAPPQG
ncbi:hypothetical protein [Planomonospora venezuelensis]|uniref:Uncharacterized protein n=1 Tax=Planomonospora venezuelensis TaxID=1999 RepID=A0A841D7R0_PLAVE|nr:hypothetical protein [Planomonospora venezuelensis]MBB5965499.1 hypothetical protein [Planomonospora venezuelensis]